MGFAASTPPLRVGLGLDKSEPFHVCGRVDRPASRVRVGVEHHDDLDPLERSADAKKYRSASVKLSARNPTT